MGLPWEVAVPGAPRRRVSRRPRRYERARPCIRGGHTPFQPGCRSQHQPFPRPAGSVGTQRPAAFAVCGGLPSEAEQFLGDEAVAAAHPSRSRRWPIRQRIPFDARGNSTTRSPGRTTAGLKPVVFRARAGVAVQQLSSVDSSGVACLAPDPLLATRMQRIPRETGWSGLLVFRGRQGSTLSTNFRVPSATWLIVGAAGYCSARENPLCPGLVRRCCPG